MPSTEEILDDLKRDNDRNIRVFDNWKDTFGKLFESMVEKAIKANESYEELKSREREMNEEPERSYGSASTRIELLTNLLKKCSDYMLDEIELLKQDEVTSRESYESAREVAHAQYDRRISDIDKACDDIQLFVQVENLLGEVEERSGEDEVLKARIGEMRKKVSNAGDLKARTMSPYRQMRAEAAEAKEKKTKAAWDKFADHCEALNDRADDLESMRDLIYRHSGRR